MTEREAVLAQREAFARGAAWAIRFNISAQKERVVASRAELDYPLPTITRPRVVQDPHALQTHWKILNGEVVVVWGSVVKPWNVLEPEADYKPTPERIKLWASLLAQPTETVDA